MNFIYKAISIYNYCKDTLVSYYSKQPDVITKEQLMQEYTFNPDFNPDVHYFFINTANIYNATELIINRLNNEYKYKLIKIYLLKSHTLTPLFNSNYIIATDKNIKKIHKKLQTHRRHLHTFIDAIDSFIEYNNVHNYSILY